MKTKRLWKGRMRLPIPADVCWITFEYQTNAAPVANQGAAQELRTASAALFGGDASVNRGTAKPLSDNSKSPF